MSTSAALASLASSASLVLFSLHLLPSSSLPFSPSSSPFPLCPVTVHFIFSLFIELFTCRRADQEEQRWVDAGLSRTQFRSFSLSPLVRFLPLLTYVSCILIAYFVKALSPLGFSSPALMTQSFGEAPRKMVSLSLSLSLSLPLSLSLSLSLLPLFPHDLEGLIKQFLLEVEWGEIDYLLIDTPPGTSDEHISLSTYLKGSNVAGAIIVTTPQALSLFSLSLYSLSSLYSLFSLSFSLSLSSVRRALQASFFSGCLMSHCQELGQGCPEGVGMTSPLACWDDGQPQSTK
jgi:hypothetical protein